MDLQRTSFVQRVGTDDPIAIGTVERPIRGATFADFGRSISEGRTILANLQQIVAQSQIRAYDEHQRRCRHCGATAASRTGGHEPSRPAWVKSRFGCHGL